MTEQLRVLLLDPHGCASLVGRTGQQVGLHRCADVADMVGRAAAGAADVAVLAPGSAGLDALVVGRLRAHGCRVVAIVAERADADLARRIGITEQLAVPLDAVALLALSQRPAPVAAAGAAARSGVVAAVWGPPGSPGRTTAAALLAVGARRAGQRVIVVDADLATGTWSLLSVSPCSVSGLPVALRRATAGGTAFADLLVQQADGIDLLPLIPDPQRWMESAPTGMPILLDVLSSCSDVVVIDVGADIRPAHPAYDIGWAHDSAALARAALEAADTTLAVLSAEPLGVHRFASWWSVLSDQVPDPVIVANRVGAPRTGRRPGEQLTAVLESVGAMSNRVDIPWDPKSAEGLVAGDWTGARGWRGAPDRLWQAVSRAAAVTAA